MKKFWLHFLYPFSLISGNLPYRWFFKNIFIFYFSTSFFGFILSSPALVTPCIFSSLYVHHSQLKLSFCPLSVALLLFWYTILHYYLHLIHCFLSLIFSFYPVCVPLCVLGPDVPGEGEHKVMDMIRSFSEKVRTAFSFYKHSLNLRNI